MESHCEFSWETVDFDALGQDDAGVGSRGVGAGLGQVEKLFVLERLGGGAVGGPVVLVLVQVQQALQDGDDHAQGADDVGEQGGVSAARCGR